MGKVLAGLVVAVTLVGFSLPANAVIISVSAAGNSSTGGTGLNTGVNVTTGDDLWITVNPNDCWSAGTGNRTTNADGLVVVPPSCQAATWPFGNHTQGGLTAPFASLVGMIGANPFFFVGTNFNATVAQSGLLLLYFFDSNAGDNSGSVLATIMNHGQGQVAVPEPNTILLLSIGLAVLGFARRWPKRRVRS